MKKVSATKLINNSEIIPEKLKELQNSKEAFLAALEKLKSDSKVQTHFHYVNLINMVYSLNHKLIRINLSAIRKSITHFEGLIINKSEPLNTILSNTIVWEIISFCNNLEKYSELRWSMELIKLINLTELIRQNLHKHLLGIEEKTETHYDVEDYYYWNYNLKPELVTSNDLNLKILQYSNYKNLIIKLIKNKESKDPQSTVNQKVNTIAKKMIQIVNNIKLCFDSNKYPTLIRGVDFMMCFKLYFPMLFFMENLQNTAGLFSNGVNINIKEIIKFLFTTNQFLMTYLEEMNGILAPFYQAQYPELSKAMVNKHINTLVEQIRSEINNDDSLEIIYRKKFIALNHKIKAFVSLKLKNDIVEIISSPMSHDVSDHILSDALIELLNKFIDNVITIFQDNPEPITDIDLQSLLLSIKSLSEYKVNPDEKKYFTAVSVDLSSKILTAIDLMDESLRLKYQKLLLKVIYKIILLRHSQVFENKPSKLLVNTEAGFTLKYYQHEKTDRFIRSYYTFLSTFISDLVNAAIEREPTNTNLFDSIEATGQYLAHLINHYALSDNENNTDVLLLSDLSNAIIQSKALLLFGEFKIINDKVDYSLLSDVKNGNLIDTSNANKLNPVYVNNNISMIISIISISRPLRANFDAALKFTSDILETLNLSSHYERVRKDILDLIMIKFFIEKNAPILDKKDLELSYDKQSKRYIIRGKNPTHDAMSTIFDSFKNTIGNNKYKKFISYDESLKQIYISIDCSIEEKALLQIALYEFFNSKKLNYQKANKTKIKETAPVTPLTISTTTKSDSKIDHLTELKNKFERITFGHQFDVRFNPKDRNYIISLYFKYENDLYHLKLPNGILSLAFEQLQNIILVPLANKISQGSNIFEFKIHENQISSPIFKNAFFATLKSIKIDLKRHLAEKNGTIILEKETKPIPLSSVVPMTTEINADSILKKMKLTLFAIINDKSFTIAMNWMKLSNQPISDKISFFIQQSDVKCFSHTIKILDFLSYLSMIIKPKNTLILKENTLIVSLSWLNNFDKDKSIYQNLSQKIQTWVEKNKITMAMPEIKKIEKKSAPAKSKAHVYTHAESGSDHPYMTNLKQTQEFKRHCKLFIDLELKSANKDSIYLQAAFMLFHHALRYLSNNCGAQNKQAITTLADNILTGKFYVNHENANKLFIFLSEMNKLYGNKSIAQSSVAIKISEAYSKLDLEMMPLRPATIADLNFYISIFAKLPYIMHQEKPVNSVLHANLYLLLQIGRIVLELSEGEKNVLFKLAAFKLFFESAMDLFKIVKATPEKMLSTFHQQINDILKSFSIGTPEDNREKLINLMNEFECIKEQNQSAQIWGPG